MSCRNWYPHSKPRRTNATEAITGSRPLAFWECPACGAEYEHLPHRCTHCGGISFEIQTFAAVVVWLCRIIIG